MNAVRILVVDDDKLVLNATVRVLERAGYEVHTAMRAKVALEMIPVLGIVVVVSDLEMPEMDGNKFCVEAKKTTPNLGFILQSGHSEVTKLAVECGASYGFVKPVDPSTLREAVAELIAHRATA